MGRDGIVCDQKKPEQTEGNLEAGKMQKSVGLRTGPNLVTKSYRVVKTFEVLTRTIGPLCMFIVLFIKVVHETQSAATSWV